MLTAHLVWCSEHHKNLDGAATIMAQKYLSKDLVAYLFLNTDEIDTLPKDHWLPFKFKAYKYDLTGRVNMNSTLLPFSPLRPLLMIANAVPGSELGIHIALCCKKE
ncbi:hypothetical protein VNO77_25530 [Canavalia gladiata]|uniref:Uncharacterized protein n=1 Tax=Canavalia gladiata TaxID=3824 RepID=A0AAN9QH67_CANGL